MIDSLPHANCPIDAWDALFALERLGIVSEINKCRVFPEDKVFTCAAKVGGPKYNRLRVDIELLNEGVEYIVKLLGAKAWGVLETYGNKNKESTLWPY